jgi:hypothetical protein
LTPPTDPVTVAIVGLGFGQQVLIPAFRGAAHCEVQLAQEDAAPEHLLLEVRGEAVIGHARCLRPEPLLNGAPFLDGPSSPTPSSGSGRRR